MTRAVQHVGVPSYQWQTSVLWDGSLFFGPQLWRDQEAVKQEVEALGNSLMDVSVGYGNPLHFIDRPGLGSPQIRQSLEEGRLIIPHIETHDGDLIWDETLFAHLLGRKLEEGMNPQPDDVHVTHALFRVRNTGKSATVAHLWLHFGNTSQLKLGYKVGRGDELSSAIDHHFEAPFGKLDNKVRYVIPNPHKGKVLYHEELPPPKGMHGSAQKVIEWQVPLAAGEEAEFRLLIPFGLVEPGKGEEIAKLESDALLADARRFWKHIIDESSGTINVPDKFINEYAAVVVGQMTAQIGYRHKAKLWMYKSTPAWYELYWPPCPARALPTLDLRGLSVYSRPCLKAFIDTQTDDTGDLLHERREARTGQVASEGFERRPGYLGNFGPWTMNTMLISHGMELWALASHFRITRDRAWLGEGPGSPLAAMLLACDWIAAQRRRTMREENGKKVAHWGLYPAASAHDWLSGNVVWNDAYSILGMIETVRLLREIDHPRAEEIGVELADYRSCLRDRYREARDRARRLPLPDGTTIPYVPRDLYELDWAQTDWTYTYCGMPRAGAHGAIDPDDELVTQSIAFLEAGLPKGEGFYMWENRDEFGHPTADVNFRDIKDPKADRHYMWRHYVEYELAFNLGVELFLQRDDLPRFFEWFFNEMSIGVHHGFKVGVESEDGVPSECPGDAVRWRAIRYMFVNERGGFDGGRQSLWLCQAIPRAWLKPGVHMGVKRMGTHLGGTVDVDTSLAQDRNSVTVTARLDLVVQPAGVRLRLRSDDGRPLASATINGQKTPVLERDTVKLPDGAKGEYHVVGYFAGSPEKA